MQHKDGCCLQDRLTRCFINHNLLFNETQIWAVSSEVHVFVFLLNCYIILFITTVQACIQRFVYTYSSKPTHFFPLFRVIVKTSVLWKNKYGNIQWADYAGLSNKYIITIFREILPLPWCIFTHFAVQTWSAFLTGLKKLHICEFTVYWKLGNYYRGGIILHK